MSNDIIKTNEELREKVNQERMERYKYCSATLVLLLVDGVSYSVMSLFDQRDEQTAKDKMKYLVE
jgi:hypothetical protein